MAVVVIRETLDLRDGAPNMSKTIRMAAVIGTTSWGTVLAVQLARNGIPVVLVARTSEEASVLEHDREHRLRLPGVVFPDSLRVTTAFEAIADADLVCFVVPSIAFKENLETVHDVIHPNATVLSATKGIDISTGQRMSELIAAVFPGNPTAVLSGPNLSREVASGLPTTTVVASVESVEALRDAFHSPVFRVYTSHDVVGVELGGALKNVVAIAGGIVDHFEFGQNAKAAVLTRGLAEMTRLAVAAGADPLTLQGLAGMGDLIATAYSSYSRNRRLGELLASGLTLGASVDTIGETVEGTHTVPAALRLATNLSVEMPLTASLDAIMRQKMLPTEAIETLMAREPTSELR